MTSQMRLISFITLFLAVVLPSIALFLLDNKTLARILFALVIIIGYGWIVVLWRRERRNRQ